MASVIADMALPGLTGVSLAGPLASAPAGFAALLAPAPVPVTAAPSVQLSLPKGIDVTIAAALMPADFGAVGQNVASMEPVTPLATAIPENSELANGPAASPSPLDASDTVAQASPVPAASLPQASAVTPADEPVAPARTPDATPDRNVASPDLFATTKPPAKPKPTTEPLAADPAPEAAAQAQPVSEPAEAPTPRAETSTPIATRPIAAKTPRLARTLAPTPELPDNSAPSPEAPPSPIAAKVVSPDHKQETEQPVEEAPVPATLVQVDAPLAVAPVAATEPAPMRTETKAAPASEPAAQPVTTAAVRTQAPAIADAPVPSDTSTPPLTDNGTAMPEPATPTVSTAATPEAAAASSSAPSFGELVAPKPVAAPPPAAPGRTEHPTPVSARPDRIAPETAVAISRHLATGGAETITIRLDPVDMGRIEVRLSFDDSGALRGVIAADNPAALDLLRRDQAGLVASLSDAGVATDAQSFRFDARSDDRGGQRQWTQRQSDSPAYRDDTPNDEPQPEDYRPLISRGRVDVIA